MPKNPPIVLEFRWSISRGRETDGYNICSLYANGVKVASCKGGGYDMKGTCFGEYLTEAYQERLLKIHHRAHMVWGKDIPTTHNDKPDRLYGTSAKYVSTTTPGISEVSKVSIDGAFGMSSVQAIAEAIGLDLCYVSKMPRDGSMYRLEDSIESPE